MTTTRRPLGVAIAGFGWMGRVHTQAYARLPHHYPQLTLRPRLVAVAEDVPGRAEEAAERFGFASATRDWREVAADPRVQAVSITAPNFLHREIGAAMAGAGKHVWIEKPVGLTAEDARAGLHRATALAARLDRLAPEQPCPQLVEQIQARADEARRRPPVEATEPELTQHLAMFWLEHRDELPSPGSGELPPNEFVRFVTDCATALGIHPPPEEYALAPPRWHERYRRWRKRTMERLGKLRARRG